MEIDYDALGLKIRTLRESLPKKTGREKLAEYVGVTGTTIYRWETGEGKPDLDHILKLCEVFKISLYQMIDFPNRSDLISNIVSRLSFLSEKQLASVNTLVETASNKANEAI